MSSLELATRMKPKPFLFVKEFYCALHGYKNSKDTTFIWRILGKFEARKKAQI